MVTLHRLDSARLAASLLRETTSSRPKARLEPMAAAIRKNPPLSAEEASKNPMTSNKVVFPFIVLSAFPFGLSVYKGMLAPASDKTARDNEIAARLETGPGFGGMGGE